jgi:proteasome lid subunit RPN8/RPN11
MKTNVSVSVSSELLQSIFEGARRLYPKETILLLRGKRSRDIIKVFDVIIPPFATYGRGFANIRTHMLPMDFSIIGTAHSHPSGDLRPSPADLNHFFGTILMIVGYPFEDQRNVAVYDHEARELGLSLAERASTY